MIRNLGENNGTCMVEIAGTPNQLAKEAAVMVQAIYNSLHIQDPRAGEVFRQTFCAEYGKGSLWKTVSGEIRTISRRPGPKIPTQ